MRKKNCLTSEILHCTLNSLAKNGNIFSAEKLSALDRLEAFPIDACQILDKVGLNQFYVPKRHGGLLDQYQELLQLWRIVARRDMTVIVAHAKTFLGAVCIWLAGTFEQTEQLASDIIKGTVVSWGLTERHHGSDLLAGEVQAKRIKDNWSIKGEKWLINNATRGQLISLLARTDPDGGPRGFSLFLIDKRRLQKNVDFYCLPKEKTHGIRGADISGIMFKDACIPNSALIGKVGDGIEIVLKALQLTRTLCAGLSLGAAEHALQLTVNFAKEHQLYDKHLIQLPLARKSIGESFAMLLISEVVSTVAARSIHSLTTEMSVTSAITKALVPTLVDDLISQLSELLGARAFLLEEYAHGMFQKIERDHRIISIFDGSTIVNKNIIINQFHILARAYTNKKCNKDKLYTVMNLSKKLDEFDEKKLSLISLSGSSIVQNTPKTVKKILALTKEGYLPETVGRMAKKLQDIIEMLITDLISYEPSSQNVPSCAFMLASRYELCFAGSTCLQLWVHNNSLMQSHPLWCNALWLESCLTLILNRLECKFDTMIYDRLTDKLTKNNEMQFSLFPIANDR